MKACHRPAATTGLAAAAHRTTRISRSRTRFTNTRSNTRRNARLAASNPRRDPHERFIVRADGVQLSSVNFYFPPSSPRLMRVNTQLVLPRRTRRRRASAVDARAHGSSVPRTRCQRIHRAHRDARGRARARARRARRRRRRAHRRERVVPVGRFRDGVGDVREGGARAADRRAARAGDHGRRGARAPRAPRQLRSVRPQARRARAGGESRDGGVGDPRLRLRARAVQEGDGPPGARAGRVGRRRRRRRRARRRSSAA